MKCSVLTKRSLVMALSTGDRCLKMPAPIDRFTNKRLSRRSWKLGQFLDGVVVRLPLPCEGHQVAKPKKAGHSSGCPDQTWCHYRSPTNGTIWGRGNRLDEKVDRVLVLTIDPNSGKQVACSFPWVYSKQQRCHDFFSQLPGSEVPKLLRPKHGLHSHRQWRCFE